MSQKLEKPLKKSSELTARVVSSLVLIILVFAVTYAGGWFFKLFLCVLGILAMFEWVQMTLGLQKPTLIHYFITCIPSLILTLFWASEIGFEYLLIFVAISFLFVWFSSQNQRLRNTLWIVAGLIYVSSFLIAMQYLRGETSIGFYIVFAVFIIVWAADSFAYFSGRLIGGPKLAPSVSPSKTWSGALGGFVGAILLGFLYLWIIDGQPISFSTTLLFIALVTVMSQLGDLFESGVKRQLGVKDSGNLIPGHGGVLDRIDALVFASISVSLIKTSSFLCISGGTVSLMRNLVCQS